MPFCAIPSLDISDVDDEWILAGPLIYSDVDGRSFVIPRGFVTDLASIPRVFHPLIKVNGKHRPAAIVHDWLYETQRLTRAQSDLVFLRAMQDCGVRWSQRWVMYLVVRAGGWLPWSRRALTVHG